MALYCLLDVAIEECRARLDFHLGSGTVNPRVFKNSRFSNRNVAPRTASTARDCAQFSCFLQLCANSIIQYYGDAEASKYTNKYVSFPSRYISCFKQKSLNL